LKALKNDESMLLTKRQQHWMKMQQLMVYAEETTRLKLDKGANRFHKLCWNLSACHGLYTQRFDYFIMSVIVLNALAMSISHFGQPLIVYRIVEFVNYVCAAIFGSEAIVKISGLGLSEYLKSHWNKFDIFLVVASTFGVVMKVVSGARAGLAVTALRAFRLGRLLKLLRRAKGLRGLFNTVLITLPAMANTVSLLLLVYYTYAVVGMQQFWKVNFDGRHITEHTNFRTFSSSLLTVIKISIGHDWGGLMHELGSEQASCIASPIFNASVCGFTENSDCIPLNGCGDRAAAIIFFTSFSVVITFVFVNLLSAVVLEATSMTFAIESGNSIYPSQDGDVGLEVAEYICFCEAWYQLDPELSKELPLPKLYHFLSKLPEPLGFAIDEPDLIQTQREEQQASCWQLDEGRLLKFIHRFQGPHFDCPTPLGKKHTKIWSLIMFCNDLQGKNKGSPDVPVVYDFQEVMHACSLRVLAQLSSTLKDSNKDHIVSGAAIRMREAWRRVKASRWLVKRTIHQDTRPWEGPFSLAMYRQKSAQGQSSS